MNNVELRKLRAQLMLVGSLFAVSIAVAIVTATHRPFFEYHLRETYAPLPADLATLAAGANRGTLDPQQLESLDTRQLEALYENWMASQDSEIAPKLLVAAHPIVYIDRVEQTLVCGSDEQRTGALRFVYLAGALEAIPMLERFRTWAARRRLDALVLETDQTVSALRRDAAD